MGQIVIWAWSEIRSILSYSSKSKVQALVWPKYASIATLTTEKKGLADSGGAKGWYGADDVKWKIKILVMVS